MLHDNLIARAINGHDAASRPRLGPRRAMASRCGAGDLAGAAAIQPLRAETVALLGGILVTYGMVLACVLFARRTPRPFVIALGLAPSSRLVVAVVVLGAVLRGIPVGLGTDEAQLARLLKIPTAITTGLSVAVLVVGWTLLIRAIPRPRLCSFSAIALGTIAGLWLYMVVVGPRVLP